MSSRLLAALAAGSVLALAAGCGPGAATPPGNGSTAPTQGTTAKVTPDGQVAAESCTAGPIDGAQESHITGTHDMAPSDFTVPVGGSITWFNDSTLGHTITFSEDPDCGYVIVNASVSVTFNTPGVFTYVCRIYPNYMSGTVVVQ